MREIEGGALPPGVESGAAKYLACIDPARTPWRPEEVARLISTVLDLLAALRPIAAAYPDDPGTSDLYDEQPVTITLGDVRRAWAAIAKAEGRP